jgi:hypothetical protein
VCILHLLCAVKLAAMSIAHLPATEVDEHTFHTLTTSALVALLPKYLLVQQLRSLLVELCLLLPAALRVLVELVLLPRLVKPLALALRGSDDLIGLGLRTFEVTHTAARNSLA